MILELMPSFAETYYVLLKTIARYKKVAAKQCLQAVHSETERGGPEESSQ